jgi:biopolymer transport protein ExbD
MKLIDNDDKEISEINMTPFVDIVLVLLIIFMATATFMVEGKIPLNLPKASTAEAKEIKEKKVEITIKKDGSLYYNNKPITLAQLKEELKGLKGKDITVILRSDKETKFENVVTIIDICRKEGIEKYMIDTEKE